MSREPVGRAFQPWYARPKLPRQTPDPDLVKEYSMHLRLVGIDCATQDAKIGVAFGSFRNETVTVLDAFACTKEKTAAIEISKWLQEGEKPALLAIDAPLGWPQTLSRVLATHRAGEELKADAHDMFRRATDVFIKQKTGKTPLDVGADRIARTAHAALCLLRDIRCNLKLERIALAWEWPPAELLSAIEVYPAGTLKAHRFRSSGYKKFNQIAEREETIRALRPTVLLPDEVLQKMESSADVLDAVVCLLAARDFLLGEAMPPTDRNLAKIEGWIWTRDPVLALRDQTEA